MFEMEDNYCDFVSKKSVSSVKSGPLSLKASLETSALQGICPKALCTNIRVYLAYRNVCQSLVPQTSLHHSRVRFFSPASSLGEHSMILILHVDIL